MCLAAEWAGRLDDSLRDDVDAITDLDLGVAGIIEASEEEGVFVGCAAATFPAVRKLFSDGGRHVHPARYGDVVGRSPRFAALVLARPRVEDPPPLAGVPAVGFVQDPAGSSNHQCL